MSLVASLEQVGGDIWSINGISFGSGIQDILDKDEFTLEELLEEVDLLQEVKSANHKLIEFLSSEASISKMIDYVTIPTVGAGEDELRSFKYPYISCEVICLEVPEIVRMIIRHQDSKYFRKLLEFLRTKGPLDCHLAGYFEKLLEMFFRKETAISIGIINSGGLPLFALFLVHIDNYTIMQIVQRLMLPHIPFFINDNEELEVELPQCCWAFSEGVCVLLVRRMLEPSADSDICMHISDLLITVIQLSPPGSELLTNLCCDENLSLLLTCAFDGSMANDPTVGGVSSIHINMNMNVDASGAVVDNEAAVQLSSIAVVESMISRLCESLVIGEEHQAGPEGAEETARILKLTQDCTQQLCAGCGNYLPHIHNMLSKYLTRSTKIKSQSKIEFACAGQVCLQLVKLMEALVRLTDPYTDGLLTSTGCFSVIVDLLFAFPLNSLLHLSIQRIFLMVIEGGPGRRTTQKHLLIDCQLMSRICAFFGEKSDLRNAETQQVPNPSNEKITGCRNPLVGHLVLVSQAIANLVHEEQTNNHNNTNISRDTSISFSDSAIESVDTRGVSGESQGEVFAEEKSPDGSASMEQQSKVNDISDATSLLSQMNSNNLLEDWLHFQDGLLFEYIQRFNSESVAIEELKNFNQDSFGEPNLGEAEQAFSSNNHHEEFADFGPHSHWNAFADHAVDTFGHHPPATFDFGESDFADFSETGISQPGFADGDPFSTHHHFQHVEHAQHAFGSHFDPFASNSAEFDPFENTASDFNPFGPPSDPGSAPPVPPSEGSTTAPPPAVDDWGSSSVF